MLVYGLFDEEKCFYVGITKNNLRDRLNGHLYSARHGARPPVSRHIRVMLAEGRSVEIRELEKGCGLNAEARWVEAMIAQGHGLLNMHHVSMRDALWLREARGEGDQADELACMGMALQEARTRITALESRIVDLEGVLRHVVQCHGMLLRAFWMPKGREMRLKQLLYSVLWNRVRQVLRVKDVPKER